MIKFPRTLSALALAGVALSSQVNADILGVYVGGGAWQTSYSGELSNVESVSLDELGLEDSQNTFAYIALEHPIPVIPNLKVVMNNISTDGASVITRDIDIIPGDDGFSIPLDAATQTNIDLSHIDYTLYYELLDNYVSFDLGITGRSFSGEAEINYETGTDPVEMDTETAELDGIIPMLYTKLQLDLPFTGWYIGGSANYISFEENAITDAEAKIGYLSKGLGLNVGFDLGYRSFSIVAEPDDEDLYADITLDGPYASLIVHF